jgi:Lanthionine synthetase C-like protein/HopA1 effector protein family
MTPVHPDLMTVIDAVTIVSPTRHVVLGRVRDSAPAGADPAPGAPALLPLLEADLYTRLYARPVGDAAAPADLPAQRDFLAALSAANSGRGTWDPGWVFRAVEADGRLAVVKYGLTFWAPPGAVRFRGGAPRAGEPCWVWVAKEFRHLMPGFYFAVGDGEPSDGAEPLVRFYWHLTPGGAVAYMAAVTSALNARGVPFCAKVLSDPAQYLRANAGYLYLGRRHYAGLGDVLQTVYQRVAAHLRPEVPLFTKRLAPGLGVAEDPLNGLSFGQHRCRLVAQALWRSFLQGDRTREAGAATLAAVFREAGRDPESPYLEPGSTDDYAFPTGDGPPPPAAEDHRVGVRENLSGTGPPAGPPERFLEAAARLGRTLCRSAWWDPEGVCCNWVGRAERGGTPAGGAVHPTAAALGPGVYDGSAGVALFLAQLWDLTRDPAYRRAALGAVRRSLRQFGRQPPETAAPLSYYTGLVGLACALHRVGVLTGECGLDDDVDGVLAQVAAASATAHPLDVISGHAGAVPAFLSLSRTARWRHTRAWAVALGEELCRKAVRTRDGWYWETEQAYGPGCGTTPLTGFAHGQAGLGLALLELHAATGRGEFLEGGRAAFAWEDTSFSPREGNWPDFRWPGTPSELRYAAAWCHGAPGIGLARLRARALDPDCSEAYTATAHATLRTTMAAFEHKAKLPRADASLCHGLAGLAEIVLTAGQWVGEAGYRVWARARAAELIGRHADDWPSGTPCHGPNPSLMLGTAGIGYHFLRQYAPQRVPPVLIVT